MRILYVVHAIPPYEYSGTPVRTAQYARHAVAAGVTAAIAFRRARGSIDPSRDGVTLLPVQPATGYPWTLTAFSAPLKDARWTKTLKSFRPDLVHILDWVGLPSAMLAAIRSLEVPVVRHVCNMEDLCAYIEPIRYHSEFRACQPPLSDEQCVACLERRGDFRRSRLEHLREVLSDPHRAFRPSHEADRYAAMVADKRRAFRLHLSEVYDTLLFPCRSFADYFLSMVELPDIPVSVIEHGMALPTKCRLGSTRRPAEPLHCVFLGPCTSRKGWNHVEQAFGRLLRDYPGRLRLTAYGGQPPSAGTVLAGLPGVSIRPSFPREALDDVLDSCHLGLVPSPFETYCQVCREMLARGIPVIGSTAFGIPDAVRNGENGLLIGSPTAEGMYAAVRTIIETDGLLERLAVGARTTHLRTAEEEFAELLALYERLIDSH